LAQNPRDVMAWFRSLQLLDGIGPATAARALGHLSSHRSEPGSLRSFAVPASAAESLEALVSTVEDLNQVRELAPTSRSKESGHSTIRC